MNKYLSFGEKIVKIGPADPEIICLGAIMKKRKKQNIQPFWQVCQAG